VADGTGIRVEPIALESLESRDGRLLIPAAGTAIDDEDGSFERYAMADRG